jgi:glycosyltransferase involved in cell wall biosynthesis
MKLARILGTLEPGGAQLTTMRLAATLNSYEDIETVLLAGDATPPGLALADRYGLRVDAYRVADEIPRPSVQWTASAEFADWLAPRLAGADLVHGHMFGAWWAAAQAAPAGMPVIASEHNEMTWPGEDHTAQAAAAASRVSLFFAQGPAARAWAAAIGVDDTRLRQARSSVEGLSAEPLPGLPSPRVTFAGRFRADKAPDILVEALALLDDPPQAYLVGDGAMREDLAAMISARGLETVVQLPGWSYEPARFVAGATAHVVPSRQEAWSQSAVIALGLGVPVIGTDVDGLAVTLSDGRGILVPPDDPRALADALAGVLAGHRPDPCPGMTYARQFTAEAAAQMYYSAYGEVLAGR